MITNYHSFLSRTAREVQGVAGNTRKLLRAGRSHDPFVETDEQVVDRVLRDLGGRGRGEVIVLNDEAHDCYQDKPLDEAIDREAKERNEGARVWFRGLRAVARRVGVKAIYDLSATPFYLGGSGYQELHLPVGGQRLLADGRHRVRDRQDPTRPCRRRRGDRPAELPPRLGPRRRPAAQEAGSQGGVGR